MREVNAIITGASRMLMSWGAFTFELLPASHGHLPVIERSGA